MDYVLPNRKAFADSITRIFLKYRKEDRDPLSEDKDVDLCLGQQTSKELFPYQKLIRDYMMIETPYRGILLYHGLGSGKTCSSIAIGESLVTKQRVVVMTPASLAANYRGEFATCPLFYEQHWSSKQLTDDNRAEAIALGISQEFMEKHGKYYVTAMNKEANFLKLPKTDQDMIRDQVTESLTKRFEFINYNGLSRAAVEKLLPEDAPNPFDDSVVIIDEVHNFISRIAKKDGGAITPVYNAIYRAKKCKVVVLSGTPIINKPNEIAYLMNLIRGPIERITIPFKTMQGWDEAKMSATLKAMRDVDTVEFNAVKKVVMVTRNPPQFSTVYNNTGERVAVQYKKDMQFVPVPSDWVASIKSKFDSDNGTDIAVERVTFEELECLPTKMEEFSDQFLDGLSIKNPLLFQRRIQGLVSYFKGADERLLPRRVEDEKMMEKVPMSLEQFNRYLETRNEEMKGNKPRVNPLADDMKNFRVKSRLVSNFCIPKELMKPEGEEEDEDHVPDKSDILARLKAEPEKYLSKKGLEIYGPKMLRLLNNLDIGEGAEWRNQFVYSQYRSLEGLGVLAAILEANGWQAYKIVNKNNQWVEGDMDSNKPAFAFYTGEEKEEEREFFRQIFNNKYDSKFPESLKTSIKARGKKLLCLLMASSSGAEGITLLNVRNVHIMEPHWTPARHDQVIGRAIRICSHASLPLEERTVRVSFYLSVFSDKEAKSSEGANVVRVRRADTAKKRYEGSAVDVFMSTDEYLYEASYEKDLVNKKISVLLKQSAVDCEIHRKLHSREKPVLSCMRFDSTVTGEDLAFKPSVKTDETDSSYLRNMDRKHRRLQQVLVKGIKFLYDLDSQELFDPSAFSDNQRLIRVGVRESDTKIRYVLSW